MKMSSLLVSTIAILRHVGLDRMNLQRLKIKLKWNANALTSMCTASTVFSSPCWRNETEALCRSWPKRCLNEVIYWCRRSEGSERANPELIGSTIAIISGNSCLHRDISVFGAVQPRNLTDNISLVLMAARNSSGVVTSFANVGMPVNALRTKLKCL